MAMRLQLAPHLVTTGRIEGVRHDFITISQLLLDLSLQLAPSSSLSTAITSRLNSKVP